MVAIAGTSLQRAKVRDLRPTQMTVGFREVRRKLDEWKKTGEKPEEKKFIENHMIPALVGPKGRFYIVDHHHLARALHEHGAKDVLVAVLAKLEHLKKQHFWTFLDNNAWLHPYDGEGKRRHYDQLPETVADLEDDPYRSLAGELRRAGGFAKEGTPYTEFLWADAVRQRIDRKLIDKQFARALEQALEFARSPEADYLPGWCGPHS
jgi:hypothetical protein